MVSPKKSMGFIARNHEGLMFFHVKSPKQKWQTLVARWARVETAGVVDEKHHNRKNWSWNTTILNLGQTWCSTRTPIRKYGRVREENMKKHLLGWGPGYYNLYVYLYIPWNHSYLQYFQSANLDQTARSVVVSTFHIFFWGTCSVQPKPPRSNIKIYINQEFQS